MPSRTSLCLSTALHAIAFAGAWIGWHAVSSPPQRTAYVVFAPSTAAAATPEAVTPAESLLVEPLREEIPDAVEPAEPPAERFEPPEPRPAPHPEPSAPEPRNLFARVELPAPIPKESPPVAAESAPSSYVEAAALDAENEAPTYPPLAVRRGWTGTVVLSLRIDADGHVTSVSVAESSGRELLDHAAREAARSWLFAPARRDGVAVASTKRLPVEFRLIDG